MALRERLLPWTQQPQDAWVLDQTAAAGLGLDVVLSGSVIARSTGEQTFLSVAAGTPSVQPGIAGLGTRFSGGTQRMSCGALGATDNGPFTLEVLCAITAAPSLAGFCSISPDSGTGGGRGLLAYTGTRNIYFWGNSADVSSGVDWRVDGSLQHVFCVSMGSGQPMYFYRDGSLIATKTTPTLIATSAASTWSIGDTNRGWGSSPTGQIFKVARYGRALTAAEVAEITGSPWGFAEPQRIFVPVAASGGGASTYPVGLSTETNAALGLAGLQQRVAGLASESSSALALVPLQMRPVALAAEASVALALAARQIRTVGLAAESDIALALAAVQRRAAGVAAESDQALALSSGASAPVGVAIETDLSLQLGARQIRAAGLALELDAALALAPYSPGGVGVASEADVALALAAVQRRAVGMATEVDSALARTAAQARTVGLSAETSAALGLQALHRRAVGIALESDTALALVSTGGAPTLQPGRRRAAGVPAIRRAAGVPVIRRAASMATVTKVSTLDIDEGDVVVFDFTDLLTGGVTIADATVEVDVRAGAATDGAAILSGARQISGATVLQKVQGAGAPADYAVRCVATCSDDIPRVIVMALPVRRQ